MTKKQTAPAAGSTTTTTPATPAPVVIADDFTDQEISDHLNATMALIVNVEAQWPGLVSMPSTDRVGNLGRQIPRLSPALHALFRALTPVTGESPATAATKKKLAGVFNTALGDADQGSDPGVFEVDLLVRRLDRIEAQQAIVAKLDVMRKAFADDILNTGTMVVEPGLKAIDLAKSLAASNPEFHSLLAPILDALSDMTKAARAAQLAARQAAQEQAASGTAPAAAKPAAATEATTHTGNGASTT